jgi:hypothetical protein
MLEVSYWYTVTNGTVIYLSITSSKYLVKRNYCEISENNSSKNICDDVANNTSHYTTGSLQSGHCKTSKQNHLRISFFVHISVSASLSI